MTSADAPAIPPAVCWHCGAVMTDLQRHPQGGPWVCLACKGETLEAARARHGAATTESRPAAERE
jgi:hypothetical protein